MYKAHTVEKFWSKKTALSGFRERFHTAVVISKHQLQWLGIAWARKVHVQSYYICRRPSAKTEIETEGRLVIWITKHTFFAVQTLLHFNINTEVGPCPNKQHSLSNLSLLCAPSPGGSPERGMPQKKLNSSSLSHHQPWPFICSQHFHLGRAILKTTFLRAN